ncbi:hypothetical protein K227x_61880 [Rubripirellula lacrimiformis]|uniref:Uncharacterized protein n=1 Tax=Rubripirellula lacrimiformis TaxID=1930273 RepID=A0A517NKV7_9BACT|nr:hypothetical protein K227x_61880 [Rubripirellula lacrimiformis]
MSHLQPDRVFPCMSRLCLDRFASTHIISTRPSATHCTADESHDQGRQAHAEPNRIVPTRNGRSQLRRMTQLPRCVQRMHVSVRRMVPTGLILPISPVARDDRLIPLKWCGSRVNPLGNGPALIVGRGLCIEAEPKDKPRPTSKRKPKRKMASRAECVNGCRTQPAYGCNDNQSSKPKIRVEIGCAAYRNVCQYQQEAA